jgi:hypothetical protein
MQAEIALPPLNALAQALRGELYVFKTPSGINDDMLPTDHAQLLKVWLYPLANKLGTSEVSRALHQALIAACHDSLGVFCAHQCFYVQVVNEHEGISPFVMEKCALPKALAAAFTTHASALHALEVRPGDLANDRSYKVTLAGMRILARDYQIDWGMKLPTA